MRDTRPFLNFGLGATPAMPAQPTTYTAPTQTQVDPNKLAQRIYDEMTFWTAGNGTPERPGQMREHLLFLALSLTDPKLKQDANAFYQQWTDFGKRNLTQPPANLEQAKQIAAETMPLVKNLRAFITHIKDRQNTEFVTFLYPDLLRHLIAEGDYYVTTIDRLVNQKPRARQQVQQEELCFWDNIIFDHVQYVIGLLDPTETSLINEARQHAARLGQVKQQACSVNDPSMILLSENAGEQLDSYLVNSGIGTPKVKSIIHPALAAHIVREGKRALQTMQAVKAGQKE